MGFDRDTLRVQVTERLRELAVIVVHPNLAFPVGMVETANGVGLVFRGARVTWSRVRLALNACDFLRRAGTACALAGGSHPVYNGTIAEVCWGLIGSVDTLAVYPNDIAYVAPELVGDDGRARPTDATEVFALAALCAMEWYKSTDSEDWKSRDNDVHIRPLLDACLSPDPNDRPDLDTALLVMMAEVEHEKAGWTVAHMACQRDRVDFLRSYLDGGGDVEAKTVGFYDEPASLLGVACKYGSLACVGLLLDRGADPIAGRALHWAACGGHSMLVGRLVAAGNAVEVDDFVDVRNTTGFAALLGHYDGNLDEVATVFTSRRWVWDPACLALLLRCGVNVFHWCDTRMVKKARALAAPGAHPIDHNQVHPGGGTVLNVSHCHRTRLSDDGRSVMVALSDEGQRGETGGEVTINLPSWVHVYLSTDLIGSEVIGRGAFGTVTKRKLYGTTDVAVKVVNVPGTQRGMQSFVWEVASHVMLR